MKVKEKPVARINGYEKSAELIRFRLDASDKRFESLETKIDAQFAAIDTKLDTLVETLASHKVVVAIIASVASILVSTLVATLIERAVHGGH